MDVIESQAEYLFKVNLKGNKCVWRTIALRGDQTLDDLHEAIFAAFDRFDPHLYSFYFPKAPSRRRVSGPKAKEYTAPQILEGPELLDSGRRFDATKARLDGLRLKAGQRFEYLFDFGDSWWHELSVEAIGSTVPRTRYPQIVESREKSPAQYEDVDD
ncbi:MAG: plasmid pRiA4b ORF-3 family protein [bacterium]